MSRGLGTADFDDDGDLDLVIVDNDGPVRLLENRIGQDGRWIGLVPVEARGGLPAVGSRVTLHRDSAPPLVRTSRRDGGYAASHDPRISVGLGDGPAISSVEIRWPDGSVEIFDPPPERAYTELVRGMGRTVPTT